MPLDLNKPILIFLGNLYYHGVTVTVVNGQLRVGGETAKLSPAYRDEIMRRAEQLIDLLAPAENAPPALAPYLGRLLRVDETIPALGAAEQSDSDLRLTPVNGGWLATFAESGRSAIGDGSHRPSSRRAAQGEQGELLHGA